MRRVSQQRIPALLLLMVLFALLVFSVALKSPTADEQNHLARGLAYLKTGDLRLSQEHPPGINAWEAWPLLLDRALHLPLESPHWASGEWYGFADELLWRANDRPQEMIFATRVPVMWLTVLLGALVYRWAYELGGGVAGTIALAVLTFDPNILAHGRLTTTDMGVTCAAYAAMYTLWRALRDGNGTRWVLAGVGLGVAQLAKFSALVLVPNSVLIVTWTWVKSRRTDPPRRLLWWALRLACLLGLGALVVWAGYGWSWGEIPTLPGIRSPAPAYWNGIQTILARTGGGSSSFLMGQYSQQGWWTYFPVTFAIKTPLPTLALIGLAMGLWGIRWAANRHPQDPAEGLPDQDPLGARPPNSLLCLLLPVLAFWAIAIGSSFNIGYRHILPSLPFLYTFAGWTVTRWARRHSGASVALHEGTRARGQRNGLLYLCALLTVWLAVGTVIVAPHYLSFFNEIAGGPNSGYRYLVDSNLDWGQDLPGLARYVETHDIERVYLSWFGAAHPEAYDFSFHPLPGFWRFGGDPAAYGLNPYAPAPGTYAISASNLQGIKLADRDTYAWFRERTPSANIGHSILIYEVEGGTAGGGTVVLGLPALHLAGEERTLLENAPSVRQYDPKTGTIAPLAGEQTWYIVPEAPDWGNVVRHGPGYVVVQGTQAAPEREEPIARFGPFVTMLSQEVGRDLPTQDGTLAVDVRWRVEDPPHHAAVSFAHLLNSEGEYVAGWDGLTAPATCWQPGDVIGQRYAVPLPPDLSPGTYQIEVGWYDTETLGRWPCYVDGEWIGDRFLLPEMEIRP